MGGWGSDHFVPRATREEIEKVAPRKKISQLVSVTVYLNISHAGTGSDTHGEYLGPARSPFTKKSTFMTDRLTKTIYWLKTRFRSKR